MPYAYYYKHCIIINEEHKNMNVNERTPYRFFEFLDKFPSFFIGSNASLPIVGGSILNHEHYQGGYERLPLMNAKVKNTYKHKKYNEVKIIETTWSARTLRLISKNKNQLIDLFSDIYNKWNNIYTKCI